MKYKKCYEDAVKRLEEAGISEAKLDARLLLEYVCGTDHGTLFTHPERELSESEETHYSECIQRRVSREPVAYIMGSWDFMGLSFRVNRDVLIPEQDSEILVEEAMRYCEDGMRILDLCTGSGCIALSILNYSNGTKAVCTDISDAALAVALENADRLGLSGRAEFVKTNLFPIADNAHNSKFDLIVSNPPYIKTDVIDSLAPEVRDYEPRLALDGDSDGLLFYRRIIEGAEKYLFSSGYLIMEIGYDQAEEVRGLLEQNGKYHDIEITKDYSGNDRVIRACFW